MSAVLTIAGATVREASRKKLIVALGLITLVGIALTGFGFWRLTVLAHQIGRSIFASQIAIEPVLFPIILVIAVLVTFGGSAAAIRRAIAGWSNNCR